MPLGEQLAHLREAERLTQRGLGRLAGVSYTQIGEIEAGTKGTRPSPVTLRKLAMGLATVPPRNTEVDQDKFSRYYELLMLAAGYLLRLPSHNGEGPPELTADTVVTWLTDRAGDGGLARALVRLATHYPKAGAATQQQVRTLAETAADIAATAATGDRPAAGR